MWMLRPAAVQPVGRRDDGDAARKLCLVSGQKVGSIRRDRRVASYSCPEHRQPIPAGRVGLRTQKRPGRFPNTIETPLFYAQNPAPPITVRKWVRSPGKGCLVLASHDREGYNGQGVSCMPGNIPWQETYKGPGVQREVGRRCGSLVMCQTPVRACRNPGDIKKDSAKPAGV